MKLDDFLAYLKEEPGWLDVHVIDIHARDVSGDTPLHHALWARDDEAALELIRAGADVNAMGEEGYTPLHVAVAQGNADLATHLLAEGASWDAVSELGTSARENARRSDDPALRRLADQR